MKKLWIIALVLALGLSLCACDDKQPAPTEPAPTQLPVKNVHITAGKIEPGMTAKDVMVEVTIDNQPVPCRVKLTGFVWDGYWEMADDEPVPDPFLVRLDVYYSLPAGYDVEDVNITMDCDGGEYDGTGSISFDANGNVEGWSRAFYGEEPIAPETEPTTQPETEPTTPPATQPTTPPATQPTTPPATQPTTPPATQPTQPQHTHNWVEVPGPGIVNCTLDGVRNYTCSCGQTKSETIPAPGHDLKDGAITPPTCTDSGRQTKTCKRCSHGFTIEIPATGHSWSGWVRETGLVHKRTCSTCGATETENHTIPSGSVTCSGCGVDIIN